MNTKSRKENGEALVENLNFDNIHTIVAIISGVLTISSIIFNKFRKNSIIKNDIPYIIKSERYRKGKEIVKEYFQTLTYEELLNLEERPHLIDKRIRKIIEHSRETPPSSSIIDKTIENLMRENRYKLLEFILAKTSSDSSGKRGFRILLILFSNYAYYLSKLVIYVVAYLAFFFIFATPLYYILIGLISLYNSLDFFSFIMLILIVSITLFVFAEKES